MGEEQTDRWVRMAAEIGLHFWDAAVGEVVEVLRKLLGNYWVGLGEPEDHLRVGTPLECRRGHQLTSDFRAAVVGEQAHGLDRQVLVADPAYVRTVKRWKIVEGQRVQVDHRVQIRPWWTVDEKGQTVLLLKQGLKPLEFEKGKSGIVVGSRDKLPGVIDAVIAATQSGELDALLEQTKAVNQPPTGKKKSA